MTNLEYKTRQDQIIVYPILPNNLYTQQYPPLKAILVRVKQQSLARRGRRVYDVWWN